MSENKKYTIGVITNSREQTIEKAKQEGLTLNQLLRKSLNQLNANNEAAQKRADINDK